MDQHLIQKEYLALVCGVPTPLAGMIDRPIGRQGGDIRVRQWVNVEGAVQAVTRYETLEEFTSEVSLVRAFPKTGRLHQIRVHLASIGIPLLGDPLYTGDGALYRQMVEGGLPDSEREKQLGFPRVALHAARLTFAHPITNQALSVEAPLAADMALFIKTLKLI
jgi:23S rRNA pseudouridine1911/1915/1917 synthase